MKKQQATARSRFDKKSTSNPLPTSPAMTPTQIAAVLKVSENNGFTSDVGPAK